jgi:Uma2 family endonuclease
MATAVKVSPKEYLEYEREAAFKSEYVDGRIIPMPGASREHNLVGSNIIRVLGNQLLDQPCELYGSDMKVRTRERYGYPDVTVVCGTPTFEDIETDVLLNPTVIFEILSPSTEVYDRGEKFAAYRQRESLQTYVLVSQHLPGTEMYQRQAEGGWYFSEVTGLEQELFLESIGCTLKLADIYRKVDFDQAPI